MTTMKITFLKSPTGVYNLAYFEGDTVEMPVGQARELMDAGIARPFNKVEDDPVGVDLPAEIPGRKLLLKHGIKTMEELKAFKDLTQISGIGKSTAKQITEYLNK